MQAPIKHIDAQQKEVLIVMLAIHFIEEHNLLRQEDLVDAKNSLQALFLRASGQAALLHKLIGVLRATRDVHQTFAGIFTLLGGITKGVTAVETKVALLRENLDQYQITAEEYRAFVDPFLSYSQQLIRLLSTFAREIGAYVEIKENEAKLVRIYRIARDARNQLRDRLKGDLGGTPKSEEATRIKDELTSSFDYGESRQSLQFAIAEAQSKEKDVLAQIEEIRKICQMAINPDMRESDSLATKPPTHSKKPYDDVYARFSEALATYPALERIKAPVVELFKLYQHSYGIFALDFNRLQQGIQLMMKNTEAYFEAKEEDKDIRTQREKLRRIEGLIPFLERGSSMLSIEEYNTYALYTRHLSEVLSENKAPWANIAEDLLRAKVLAEAEMSTKL